MPADRPLDPSLAPVRELPVIAHLGRRWDPTWHRPHRLLRALAAQAPVLVVEEPVVLDDVRRERLDVAEIEPGVWRALPRLPAYLREEERATGTVRALLQAAMRPDGALGVRFTAAAQWFAHAAPAGEFLDAFGEVGVVCDCLAPTASDEPGVRERALLTRADLVLASGDRAAELEALHRAVLRIDTGVDVERWASDVPTAVPADVAGLPRPIVGYIGPVDDRLDHGLLRALRTRFAQGSVVLVGPPGRAPVAGSVKPLPEGIRWLGARDEATLPAYARAFDACIFPLASSAAGRHEPPAIVECLLAGRPVVTSVRPPLPPAVAAQVKVAAEPHAFVEAVAAAAAVLAGTTVDAARVRDAVLAEDCAWAQVTVRLRGALFEAIAARPTPLTAIADALIASRGLPPGAARGAR